MIPTTQEHHALASPQRTSAFGNVYQFTARRFDNPTGLYYNRYRYYDARSGRFTGRDPMHYLEALSLYQRGLNNPATLKDPSGLVAISTTFRFFYKGWVTNKEVLSIKVAADFTCSDTGNVIINSPPYANNGAVPYQAVVTECANGRRGYLMQINARAIQTTSGFLGSIYNEMAIGGSWGLGIGGIGGGIFGGLPGAVVVGSAGGVIGGILGIPVGMMKWLSRKMGITRTGSYDVQASALYTVCCCCQDNGERSIRINPYRKQKDRIKGKASVTGYAIVSQDVSSTNRCGAPIRRDLPWGFVNERSWRDWRITWPF